MKISQTPHYGHLERVAATNDKNTKTIFDLEKQSGERCKELTSSNEKPERITGIEHERRTAFCSLAADFLNSHAT
jgi:hypothetical protein